MRLKLEDINWRRSWLLPSKYYFHNQITHTRNIYIFILHNFLTRIRTLVAGTTVWAERSTQQWLYFEPLPDVQVHHLSLRLSPATLRRKLILAAYIRDLILLLTTQSFACWLSCRASRQLSPTLMNKTPRCLNYSTWWSNSPVPRSGWLRTMVPDLDGLVLIPSASHSAANSPSESWRSLFDEANRTTSSANSKTESRGPQTWLLLQKISQKIQKKCFDNNISSTFWNYIMKSSQKRWEDLDNFKRRIYSDLPFSFTFNNTSQLFLELWCVY